MVSLLLITQILYIFLHQPRNLVNKISPTKIHLLVQENQQHVPFAALQFVQMNLEIIQLFLTQIHSVIPFTNYESISFNKLVIKILSIKNIKVTIDPY